jgi:hypothetical protein
VNANVGVCDKKKNCESYRYEKLNEEEAYNGLSEDIAENLEERNENLVSLFANYLIFHKF